MVTVEKGAKCKCILEAEWTRVGRELDEQVKKR